MFFVGLVIAIKGIKQFPTLSTQNKPFIQIFNVIISLNDMGLKHTIKF